MIIENCSFSLKGNPKPEGRLDLYQLLVHIYSNYRFIRISVESLTGASLFILNISMCIFEELVSVIMILEC